MPADLSSTVSLGDEMKAGRLIAGAAFDPAQLDAVKKAFDDARDQIAPNVSSRAEAVEAGRLRLASIVLSVAKRGILEPKKLTDEALRLMSFLPRNSRSARSITKRSRRQGATLRQSQQARLLSSARPAG